MHMDGKSEHCAGAQALRLAAASLQELKKGRHLAAAGQPISPAAESRSHMTPCQSSGMRVVVVTELDSSPAESLLG